jgi:hypothetical protein
MPLIERSSNVPGICTLAVSGVATSKRYVQILPSHSTFEDGIIEDLDSGGLSNKSTMYDGPHYALSQKDWLDALRMSFIYQLLNTAAGIVGRLLIQDFLNRVIVLGVDAHRRG